MERFAITLYWSNLGYTAIILAAGICQIVFRRQLTRFFEITSPWKMSPARWKQQERIAAPLVGSAFILFALVTPFLNPHPGR